MAEAAVAYRPNEISQDEWDLRVQLAACYRIFDYLGWTELIYNHISMRVPGPEHHFLINPYGLWYKEVTASNLVKIDLEGNIIGDSEWPVNEAGFVIHSAIHANREDAHCVMHTHTTAGMAVACQQQGLVNDNFYTSFIDGEIAYHDFEGVTVYPEEKERLVASIGSAELVILRNHGLLTTGQTIPAALSNMWGLQRACEIQLATHASGVPTIPVSKEATAASQNARKRFAEDGNRGVREFNALVREIDRIDPSYKT
ncbi:MAG: class II aldolase/adducin family protein [Minwuiales bacterium]|nr:class II aldolase/adducin family protein [Minwuiales bacterium]